VSDEQRLSRRQVIAGAGAIAAGAALTPLLRIPLPAAEAAETGAFVNRLRRMPVRKGARLTIPMKQADIPLVKGERTNMWTFGGTFPGPTIRRPAGSTTEVTFAHQIPNAGTFTIHNHGHHNEAIHDGQPMSELLPPNERRTYVYKHVEEGEPLRGAMRWYHDHSHGQTNRNLWMGLVGLFIIEDPGKKALGLPRGIRELPLVLTTRTLDANNQLIDPFLGAKDPGADAVGTGNLMLVNGTSRPYYVVEPTSYRLRILNAASFTPYNLGFGDGPKLVQIGNESGLYPAPAERERILMGPAERCDVIVDFSKLAGKRVVLSSAPQTPTSPLAGSLPPASAPEEQIMEFRVKAKRKRFKAPRPVPEKLRELPAWTKDLAVQPDRTFVFGQASQPGQTTTTWTINGEPYDPDTVVARPELGSTETWLLANMTQQSHYIHIHAVDWKVVSRNGGVPAPDEDVLKETFRLDPGETIAVGAKFTDHLGKFLIHCHMLSHEDHAMMTTFEVVEPGEGDRIARRSPAAAEAVVRGQRVSVPLDTVTPQEARRTRALLAAQLLAPGVPATPPAEPLVLAKSAPSQLCRLAT
jgi:FtsP/CotA-like multicopper oxidase with cupredoxin domain